MAPDKRDRVLRTISFLWLSQKLTPSKGEFLYAIMAVDNNKDAQPYEVPYPGPGDPLLCPGKYCGWNHQNIKANKGSFFYVIDDLNHKGSFDKRRVAEWEKQVLFAIAMQVGSHCTSWQRLLMCCVRFFLEHIRIRLHLFG